MQQQSTATLTDRDLDEIEAQMDSTVPIYVPTLVRELRQARKDNRNLLILASVVDAHFADTDAPLGRAARQALAMGNR